MNTQKTSITVKRTHIERFVFSFLIGFTILYGLEHFGKFSYSHGYNDGRNSFETLVSVSEKATAIYYKTYFGNKVETGGNGFTLADLVLKSSEFNTYSSKSYYYTQATLLDYKYGIGFSVGLFLIAFLIANFKINIS